MHDIRLIRENPAAFDAGLESRGLDGLSAGLIALDDRRRAAISALQLTQERRNALSKEIGQAKKARDEARAEGLMAEVARIKETVPELEAEEREAQAAIDRALAEIPNLPKPDVPRGADESGNVLRHEWGKPVAIAEPKQHFELGEAWTTGGRALMDFEVAGRLSGSRFVVLRGQLARLERALGQFMLDLHTTEHGYTEVSPPLLVTNDVMFGTAQLPKFAEDQFFAADEKTRDELLGEALTYANAEDVQALRAPGAAVGHVVGTILARAPTKEARWLIPTAEVPLTNLVRESILAEDELPLRLTALTPCFRAEAGAAGRDTRGMLRQHQFIKCELVSITTPEASADEHERMLGCAEAVLQKLELPYRVMTLCTGDMGFASQKTYDIEVWMPGQGTFREISSCSVCGDFQARRMDARFRPKGEKNVRHVHTLNGSGVAVGRALIAVLENYQQPDGTVAVPTVLRPYMGGLERIGGET